MKNIQKFSVESYISTFLRPQEEVFDEERYADMLQHVKSALDREWERGDDLLKSRRLAIEKGAIIGRESDVAELQNSITAILTRDTLLSEPFPSYYQSITDAIFNDLYGLAGIAPWAYDRTEEYRRSSSAKLIGEKLYCLIDGKTVLQPQRIPSVRRQQLLHALLLASPKERSDDGFHEVYLHNGIRVTIYSGERCKEDQDITVFRKYIIQRPSLEGLSARGSFPKAAIPLFRAMCAIGYNVVFAGQVRSGKTTFLQAWQACEDKNLEGVAVATDPETPWNSIFPDAPLMQLVADGKELVRIEKSLKRSDADYVILEEMRDAISYNLFLAITNLGTMRSKGTIHDSSAINIPYKMASAITAELGGDENAIISQLYTNIHFVFELCQMPSDRSKKRLRGITEFCYDAATDTVSARTICRYDAMTDSWSWARSIGEDKLCIADGSEDAKRQLLKSLAALSEASPLPDEPAVFPSYYRGNLRNR